MSEITSDLLKAMAPGPKKDLRDRFLPSLNATLPAYGIVNENQVAGFLATACFESDYFKTMHEYGKGKGRKYGIPDKQTGLVYYGRGIFQNTWKAGYQAFTDYVAKNWNFIKDRAGIPTPPNFVLEPDLVATTFWAVEAACWYWQANKLDKYAAQGVDGFFALQGMVNRGSAAKKALDYDNRLKIYMAVRKLMPADFKLSSNGSAPVTAPAPADPTAQPATPSAPATQPLLKMGDKGPDVKAVQQKLIALKFLPAKSDDSDFGKNTKAAVIAFQKSKKLDPDGKVGPDTRKALFG
jgi:predicted chitinase